MSNDVKISPAFEELFTLLQLRDQADDTVKMLVVKVVKESYEQGSNDTLASVFSMVKKWLTDDLKLCPSCTTRIMQKADNNG